MTGKLFGNNNDDNGNRNHDRSEAEHARSQVVQGFFDGDDNRG